MSGTCHHVLEIAAGTEAFAGTGDHHAADAHVAVDPIAGVDDRLDHLVRNRVAQVGAVEL